MATFLYELGRFAFRRRHFIALFRAALPAVAGVAAFNAPSAGASSFSIPGTEAQKACDLLDQRSPATARVVKTVVEQSRRRPPWWWARNR
ncbi:membrane transport protein [Streptomyces lincolnensis]|uniref:Membrane transport protein n=1 Tax=Streptomyces lincolnensis TaxID=1915 RepID=A0A1B1MLW1_STRLN|nr:membrane transport protein [Streptomyces lincolnensis]AXG58473.1 membrane transport protein [Streptomyces lincolnensis]